jgi:hypothetical protein
MGPLLHSAVRILAAIIVALAVLLGLAAVALTQCTFATLPAQGGRSADPGRLRANAVYSSMSSNRIPRPSRSS